MGVCWHHRIRHSEFLSWDPDDRNKAILWYLREADTCPVCSTRPEEWDPERGGHRQAYFGQIIDCEGCVVIQRTAAAPEMKHGRGHHVVLVRNPEVPRG